LPKNQFRQDKFEMVPMREALEVEDLVDILNYKISTLPMEFMGLPLGARYKSKVIWTPISTELPKHSLT
jgi:hypothetical protein